MCYSNRDNVSDGHGDMGYKLITVSIIIQDNLGVSVTNTEVFCLSANPRISKDNAVSVCRG